MARIYVMTGLGYAILGMLLGIFMAASHDHTQHVTHAHMLLVGLVVSFVYGVCYQLWGLDERSILAKVQLIAHQAGALLMFVGLFLMYGGFVARGLIDPVLAVASIAVLLGMLLMKIIYLKGTRK